MRCRWDGGNSVRTTLKHTTLLSNMLLVDYRWMILLERYNKAHLHAGRIPIVSKTDYYYTIFFC